MAVNNPYPKRLQASMRGKMSKYTLDCSTQDRLGYEVPTVMVLQVEEQDAIFLGEEFSQLGPLLCDHLLRVLATQLCSIPVPFT